MRSTRLIVCNHRTLHTIYGMLMIILCAFMYASLFSLIAIITGDSILENYWVLLRISMPVALLVGYNVWMYEEMREVGGEVEMGIMHSVEVF